MASESILLATIHHLSDLHFSARSDNRNELSTNPVVRRMQLMLHRRHDAGACRALEVFLMKCAEARSSLDAPTLLAVTGDMTATGDEEEFRLYEGYAKEIAGVELLPGAVRCGLAHLGFQVMEVSGNHDRFGGASAPIPLLSGPTQAFVSRHSDQPWISEVIPLAQGFKLRVIGIDGDADATALSQWRLTASGCFRSQIE